MSTGNSSDKLLLVQETNREAASAHSIPNGLIQDTSTSLTADEKGDRKEMSTGNSSDKLLLVQETNRNAASGHSITNGLIQNPSLTADRKGDHKERSTCHSSACSKVPTCAASSSKHLVVKPKQLTIPTKGQLVGAFGSIDNTGPNISETNKKRLLMVGNMFIHKDTVLGQGPNSIVYEGRLETENGMPIAVKRITCKKAHLATRTQKELNDLYKRLEREVEVLRGVEQWRHTNVVGYYQSQLVDNELYIAFQLCQGDLKDYVDDEFKFWRDYISPVQINKNMAEGLNFLHENSIVHRDLKPENVFLVWKQGMCHAVIGDFGVSKFSDQGVYSLSLSVGSIGYLAPEVWEEASRTVRRNNNARPKIRDKSDIFSLALLFFYTVTGGKHPFGDELLGCQMVIATGRSPKFDHTRPEQYALENLLHTMFHRNPVARPSMREVCQHPALWDDDAVLKFFHDCSEQVESMASKKQSVVHIVPNTLLPHGNWMRDLPDNLRHYLKTYKYNGYGLYQGKEGSARFLLRAIRNVAAHYDQLPADATQEFGAHQTIFWLKKFPHLLMHLYENIGDCGCLPKTTQICTENPLQKKKEMQTRPTDKHGSKAYRRSRKYERKKMDTKEKRSVFEQGPSSLEETIEVPSDWMPLKSQFGCIIIPEACEEFNQVAERFLREVESGPYSFKIEFDKSKLKVIEVERIQNRRLYQQFSVRKKQVAEEKKEYLDKEDIPLSRQLWHGTTLDCVTSIIKHGFNRGYSGKNGTWFGEGVYFAVDASYSARAWITQCISEENGEGHVILAEVITGQCCKGHFNMRYLPPVDPEEPEVLYDSAADKPADPMEFVIFHDAQAYPLYHLTFKCL